MHCRFGSWTISFSCSWAFRLSTGPELLKVEDVRTYICAIVLRICAKFVLLNAKQEYKHFLKMILAQFDKILQNFTCFNGVLGPFLCAKFSVSKFGCAKELSFRRSEQVIPTFRQKSAVMDLCVITSLMWPWSIKMDGVVIEKSLAFWRGLVESNIKFTFNLSLDRMLLFLTTRSWQKAPVWKRSFQASWGDRGKGRRKGSTRKKTLSMFL